MNDIRARFEEVWPVPENVFWNSEHGIYQTTDVRNPDVPWTQNRMLDTFSRCQELMAIPEITKEQVFFALCCQMEDPSDDEEDGFNAGVSWCLAFIKQEIAKRSAK